MHCRLKDLFINMNAFIIEKKNYHLCFKMNEFGLYISDELSKTTLLMKIDLIKILVK